MSCFLICFLTALIGLLPSPSLALEVKYPVISGQAVSANIALPNYLIYLFNAGVFLGFCAVFASLTIAGAMYFLSPVSVELKKEAKDRFYGAISGLLILALVYLIVVTINPQLSIFGINEPTQLPKPPPSPAAPGIYFYKSGCPTGKLNIGDKCNSATGCGTGSECNQSTKKCVSVGSHTDNVLDFGELKNKIQAVEVIQESGSNSPYVTILYNNVNLWGQCQYITTSDPDNPSQTCATVTPFASSASIYHYNFDPNGDGVYFYREACFNKVSSQLGSTGDLAKYCNKNNGGYLKVTNDCIKNGYGCGVKNEGGQGSVYVASLDDLKFTGDADPTNSSLADCTVPDAERDCINYDNDGKCIQRNCPTLAGQNISSVIINGDYVVVFIYFGQNDKRTGPWSYCEEFPTVENDVNKIGPEQMKWESIRNNGGLIPNYVLILPVNNSEK